MSTRFAYSFAALALALSVHAPNAAAALSVTATQASGLRGQDVAVTLNINSDGLGDVVNLSQIEAYTFNFLWNSAILDFGGYSSTVALSAPTLETPGAAVFNWIDPNFDNPVSFVGGLSITANFHIRSGAAYGPSTIVFGDGLGSNLTDSSFNTFEFSNVTAGPQMAVTVTAVPEPAEVSMLLAGLGLMAFAVRRRRNRQV